MWNTWRSRKSTAIILVISLIIATLQVTTAEAAGAWARGGARPTSKIDAGYHFSLTVRSDGRMALWGNSFNGNIFDIPEELDDVVALAGGEGHVLALKADGTVVAWGRNDEGQATVPEGLSNVIAIAAGQKHSLALKADGTVVAWGHNFNHQTEVPDDLTDVIAIAAGAIHSLALKADGTVVGWGYGLWDLTNPPSDLENVVAITGSNSHTGAVLADGTLRIWGQDIEPKTSTPADIKNVVGLSIADFFTMALHADGTLSGWGVWWSDRWQIPDEVSNAVQVTTGSDHTLTVLADGSFVSWGNNSSGQTNIPAGLNIPYKARAIAAGTSHAAVLKEDGTVAAWGEDFLDQSSVPNGLSNVAEIAAGYYHNLALKGDGSVVAWGDDRKGQSTIPNWGSDRKAIAVAAGKEHSLALLSDGTVAAWGAGGSPYYQTDVPGGLDNVKAIAAGDYHSLALKADGTVVGWGRNDFQQSETNGLSKIKAIAAGEKHSVALKADGTVIVWGDNSDDQTEVPDDLDNVVAIAAGSRHTLALKADGTVVAWGANDGGQIDVPDDLDNVVAIAAKDMLSMALKADGTLVEWGTVTGIPGSAELSDLIVQEAELTTEFDPQVTVYQTVYVAPTVSEVHLTPTLAEPDYSNLYVNDEPLASGGTATIELTGPMTEVTVHVEPFWKPAQTYSVTIRRDEQSPEVTFVTNGNPAPAKAASTRVIVTDGESGIDPDSLEYVWSQDDDEPADGWQPFESNDVLSHATGDGNWYLHVRAADQLGNSIHEVSNAFLLDNTPPVLTLLGEPNMSIRFDSVFVDPGAQAIDNIEGDISDQIQVTGNVNTGKSGSYTLRYNVQDSSGNVAEEVTRTVRVRSKPEQPLPSLYIDKNGKRINPDDLDPMQPALRFEVSPNENGLSYVTLPAAVLEDFAEANPDLILEMITPYASYTVPVNLASLLVGLDEILAQNGIGLEKASFKMILIDRSADEATQALLNKALPGGKPISPAVDFQLEIVHVETGQTIGTVNKFRQPLKRSLPLLPGFERMPLHWGGFRIDAQDGTATFVPARSIQRDGRWQLDILTSSNSLYVAVENDVLFNDINGHWGQTEIKSAAAKGLVKGTGGGRYEPDRPVNRAEFATLLVRALKNVTSIVDATDAAPFTDVLSGAWYFEDVKRAKALGLLKFVRDDRFLPTAPLTREEMASMLAAAMGHFGPPAPSSSASLAPYRDISDVDGELKEDIRLMISHKIMTGTSTDRFSPKGTATRAQAAAVLLRMLKTLGWID